MQGRKFLVRGPGVEHHKAWRSRYHVLAHAPGKGFVRNPRLPSIALDGGKLIIGSVPVHTVKVTADHFTWIQQSPGRYTSGHLYTLHDRLDIHGVAYVGTSPSDAVEHVFVGTAVQPALFKTSITKKSYPESTDPTTLADGEWEAGPDLEISYATELGKTNPRIKVKLSAVDKNRKPDAVSVKDVWSVDLQGRTVLHITADDLACKFYPKLFKLATIRFDPMDVDVRGWGDVGQLCSDPAPQTDVKFWKAAPRASAALRAAPALEAIRPEDVVAMSGGAELTLQELVTILPDDQVGVESQRKFVRNMKWAMGQDDTQKGWLTNLISEEPPALDDDEKKLVSESLKFYQDKFAKAYLASAFQRIEGANKPEHRLSTKQELLLHTFLSEGLAKEADYTKQHQGVFVAAYRATHPRLRDYINDKGHNWADQLYNKLTDGPLFTNTVARIVGATGDSKAMTPVNNFACLLAALDPTGTKARDYYKAVLTVVLQSQVDNVLHLNKDDLMKWLPHALDELLRELAEGGHEREGIDKATAELAKEFLVKNTSSAVTSVANLILSLKSEGLINKAQEFEQASKDTWKGTALAFGTVIGKCFLVLGWIGGLASIIIAFKDIKNEWNAMTDPQRAKFVTGIAQTVITAFDTVPMMWNGTIWVLQKGYDVASEAFVKLTDAFASAGIRNAAWGEAAEAAWWEGEMGQGAAETDKLLGSLIIAGREGEDAVVEATMYGRLFGKGIGTGVLKIFGAITAVAMAGWSLWTLIDDLKKNPSVTTKVFDSLIFCANAIAAVCLVTALFVESAVCPIIGAVAAIIGAILSILAIFFEKPANPIDQWMVNFGIPFVDGLPQASGEQKYDPYKVGLATA